MKLIWFGEGSVTDVIRMRLSSDELVERGHESGVAILPQFAFDPKPYLKKQDVAIFCRPHTWQLITLFKQQGTKVVCDIDDDFWAIPKSHVGYNAVGPGNVAAIEAMERSMMQADIITTASTTLALRMAERFGKPTIVVPNGWSKKMTLWNRPSHHDGFTRFGWSGTITHREDIKLCLKPLVQLSIANEEVQVVIGGDPEIYKLFHQVAEKQKLFVPMVPYEYYPQTLSYFDIGLAPLANDAFNQAKSDIKLYEYGLRRIPWLASPLPQYREWEVGGCLVGDYHSWTRAMEELLYDPALRADLGEQGYEKALTREAYYIGNRWLEVLASL